MHKCLVPIVYRNHPDDIFHVKNPFYEAGFEWTHEKDQEVFRLERPGDSLFVTIQCDKYIFLLITGRRATGTKQYESLQIFTRRVNLDAFWIRDPLTMYGSYSSLRKNLLSWKKLVIDPKIVLPVLCSFSMKEDGWTGSS